MWLYLIIFFIPVLAYADGDAVNRNKTFLAYYLGALALFVGLSDMFGGYDRYIYADVFDSIANGITYGLRYDTIAALTYFEPGYSSLSLLIALFSANRYIYILTITLIMYFCFYKAFSKNMTNYPLAIIIFLGMAFFFSFTYLRQVLAFSVAWVGVNYLIEGKKWKFFIIALIVASLHKSGVVFAGLYFMPTKKWEPSKVIAILAVCAIVGFSGITSSLYDAYASISTMSMNGYNADSGARIAYFLEVAFFVCIILSNYKKIDPSRHNLIFLNMSWAFCAILLLFIRSSEGGRIAWYFTLGIIYTITLIRTTARNRKKIKNSLGIVMITVMLLLYVRVYVAWQNGYYLYPYKTFLTNGHRNPDPLWSHFEYDHRYDNDKFYRPAFRFPK